MALNPRSPLAVQNMTASISGARPDVPRRSIIPLIVVLMLTAVLVILILLSGRQTAAPGLSWRFFTDYKSSFVSVRGFDRYIGDLLELRNVSLPVMNELNRLLYGVEYAADHDLTRTDFDEFLGRDFTIQFSPRFLLVTRTRKEYNVFLNLNIKDDPAVPWRRAVIHKKILKPLDAELYYSFLPDYLVVSDDLAYLKSFLKRGVKAVSRRRWPSAVREGLDASSLIVGHSGGRSVFSLLFGYRPYLLFGPELNSMKLYVKGYSPDTAFDRGSLVFFNVDPEIFGVAGKPLGAKLMIRDFHLTGKTLSMNYCLLLPDVVPSRRLAALRKSVSSLMNPSGSSCLTFPFKPWIALSDNPVPPELAATGFVFFADTVRLASLGLFPPEFDRILTDTQSISVRVIQ